MIDVRSPVTATMLLYLIEFGRGFARKLAEVAGTKSKNVHPYMKPWVKRGFVKVVKVFTMNMYTASDHLMRIASEVREVLEEVKQSTRGKMTKRKLLEGARKRFKERHGVDMDEDHMIVLQIFVDHARENTSPYIQVDPARGETLPKVIVNIAKERYGKNLDEEEVIEILRNLELAHIIFIDRRHYKARLDKSLLGT